MTRAATTALALALATTTARADIIDAGGARLTGFRTSNALPADGEVITIDLILDATDLTVPFFAWAGYRFNAEVVNKPGNPSSITPTSLLVPSESRVQVAPSLTPFGPNGSTDNFEGRRPGFQPFSSNTNGGSRSESGQASIVTATPNGNAEITGDFGYIAGFQQPFADPINNFGVNIDRECNAFRFDFDYSAIFGAMGIRFTFLELFIYPTEDSLTPVRLGNFVGGGDLLTLAPLRDVDLDIFVIPDPASAAVLLTAPLLATRRRR
ncbi:MAG: hypothetical protein AAF297_08400 [Planctomycetota bacterium]